MEWDNFYERFYDWAESTQISRISPLTSFGSSEEVTEVALAIMDEKASSRLVKKAVTAGVKFSADEIMDLLSSCDDETLALMAKTSDSKFTQEQLDDLALCVTNDDLEKLAERSGITLDDEPEPDDEILPYEEEIEPLFYEEEPPKLGWFTTFAIAKGLADLFGRKPKRHNGHCDGDCAHCPPQYGYRYDRWYYGRGHVSGCEFGGNKGDGSMF